MPTIIKAAKHLKKRMPKKYGLSRSDVWGCAKGSFTAGIGAIIAVLLSHMDDLAALLSITKIPLSKALFVAVVSSVLNVIRKTFFDNTKK